MFLSGLDVFAKKSKNFTDHQTHSCNFCHLILSQKQYLGLKLGFCALAPDLLVDLIFLKVSEHDILLVLETRMSFSYIEDACRSKNTFFGITCKTCTFTY